MFKPTTPLSMGEFVTLLAFMISILALSIDAMLPALGQIATDLDLDNPNDAQHVITAMFLGFAIGQFMAGPLSDCYGRKPVIYLGYGIFIIGCLMAALTESFAIMLIGRVLQGLGAAAPRIVGIALVRDGYEGRAMARIMSFVMAVFILVPAIAPAIGQGVMAISHWRAIFIMLLIVSVIAFFWFAIRQPETLLRDNTRTFSLSGIWKGTLEALSYRAVFGYTLAAGTIFGAFLGYLNSAQQIFQEVYGAGDRFALYFGSVALVIGASSMLNSRFVMRFGMRFLSLRAVIILTATSVIFAILTLYLDGVPPFWSFMTWLAVTLFCLGGVFGNFNALAMEPVGHMAGLGAAVVGSLSTFIALPFGWAIGAWFDGTIIPMIAGFAVMGLLTVVVMLWTDRTGKTARPDS